MPPPHCCEAPRMKSSIIKWLKMTLHHFPFHLQRVTIAVLSTAPFKQVILILPVSSIILKEAHMSTY